jgi:hypothetical protein
MIVGILLPALGWLLDFVAVDHLLLHVSLTALVSKQCEAIWRHDGMFSLIDVTTGVFVFLL